jgi:hypothetical protein
MKAQILRKRYFNKLKFCKSPKEFLMDNLPSYTGSINAGEIDPIALESDHEVAQELEKLAFAYGLKPREPRRYTGRCLLPLALSTGWHVDEGLGDVLCWMLANEALEGIDDMNRPQLITRSAVLEIDRGDVFVFNANTGHAWVSNSSCLIAQVPVSKGQKQQGFVL